MAERARIERATPCPLPAWLVFGLPLLVVVGTGLWVRLLPESAGADALEVFAQSKPLPASAPVDHRGERVDLRGAWSLWYSGFTRCPDVCPATLALLRRSVDARRQSGLRLPHVYFVSVDPQDDAAALGQYLGYFDESFRGITAVEAEGLAQALGFFLGAQAPVGDSSAHAALLAIVDPRGRLHAVVRQPIDLPGLQRSLGRLMDGA